MTTKQLISGLEDIRNGIIPIECIYDMAPEIIEKLREYIREYPIQASLVNKDSSRINFIIKEVINAD